MAQPPNKINKLYDGKIEIGFWENRHRYSLIKKGVPDSEWLISATGATGMIDKSRQLMKWAANLTKEFLVKNIKTINLEVIEYAVNLYNFKREEAATKGSAAHSWIEQHIAGEKPEMPEDENVISSINAFLDWEKKHKVKWLASEKLVYSKKYHYAGLLDAIAKIENKNYLIDFKTSKSIYPEYFLQAASYLKADEEETGLKYSGTKIVRFDKETAQFEIKERNMEEVESDYIAFLGILKVKKWIKENS